MATVRDQFVYSLPWKRYTSARPSVPFVKRGTRFDSLSCSISDTWTKIFLAVTSSSTVATWGFWTDVAWLWKSLSAISAVLAVALPILDWNRKLSELSDLHGRWVQIRNEHENLW